MKEKDDATVVSKEKTTVLGLIPIVKETRTTYLYQDKTIIYRIFGITIYKKLPTDRSLVKPSMTRNLL